MNFKNKQIGLSMIELLIALAISSFLILGITQIFIDNKRNYVFQQTQASNLDNGRFAALMLNEYLGKAGYRRSPSQLLETAFPQRAEDSDCLQFTAGSAITGLKTNSGFCIRYQPMTIGELDCQGTQSTAAADATKFDTAFTAPESSMIILAFKYEPDANNKFQEGSLRCKNLNATAPQYVELVKGVAGFRLKFGVGKTDLLEKEINTYVPQQDWTVANGAIRSVSYSMLLASRENQRDGDDSKILTDWLASSTAAEKTVINANDKNRLYQVAGSTQTLRNLMP
ncbi:PilW family protein [Pseudomonas guineae]|uniref:PilW family protein n=1 Tax=Pseudomonas guineae TaxID=425504 RepID=UPI003D04E335